MTSSSEPLTVEVVGSWLRLGGSILVYPRRIHVKGNTYHRRVCLEHGPTTAVLSVPTTTTWDWLIIYGDKQIKYLGSNTTGRELVDKLY